MKVLKFGGKSLANGNPLANVLQIVKNEAAKDAIALVVSARGKSTDTLIHLYELALAGASYEAQLEEFFAFQRGVDITVEAFTALEEELRKLLEAVRTLKVDSTSVKDQVLSYGELISAQTIVALLVANGWKARFVDARDLFKTYRKDDEVIVNFEQSEELTKAYFNQLGEDEIPVVTGFLASDYDGSTTTLGRNGSNYTATLLASFINASEVQNWTDIDGIYTASPKYVAGAKKIPRLSYKEANELANFGANVLHAKTIHPLLEKKIPLRIRNSFLPEQEGTLVDDKGDTKGIKAVSVIENVALVSIEGGGLLGKVGIDGRIFSALSRANISVRLISQASSERNVGFVIDSEDAAITRQVLTQEFAPELNDRSVSAIHVNTDMAIIAIVGRHNYALEKAIYGLRRNRIWMHLISNSISGQHISLVIDHKNLKKAVNVVHNQVFGVTKTLHLFALGKGTVGGKLLDQILETNQETIERRNLQIKIVGVADSRKFIFKEDGLGKNWREELAAGKSNDDFRDVLEQLDASGLENLVVADNTAAQELVAYYPDIIRHGFDIVASNKKANAMPYAFYEDLRKDLKRRGKQFFYETNVGAGLPLIDTLKHLHNSSDRIERIRGVFSGSLSYIFNNYSEQDKPFSHILEEAKAQGLTEPDPREDLSGMDVARKLIILAREIGMKAEFEEVQIESLIPDALAAEDSYDAFLAKKDILDTHFQELKDNTSGEEVLRYVGELEVATNTLKVSLIKASTDSPLGNIKNADSLFEIYTEGYGQQPIVIQGAGAGSEVTARGVYSDLLRLGSQY